MANPLDLPGLGDRQDRMNWGKEELQAYCDRMNAMGFAQQFGWHYFVNKRMTPNGMQYFVDRRDGPRATPGPLAKETAKALRPPRDKLI